MTVLFSGPATVGITTKVTVRGVEAPSQLQTTGFGPVQQPLPPKPADEFAETNCTFAGKLSVIVTIVAWVVPKSFMVMV